MKKDIFQISDERSGKIARLMIRRDFIIEAQIAKMKNVFNTQPFSPAAYRAKMEKIAAELGVPVDEYFAFIINEVEACGYPKYADKIRQAALLQPNEAVPNEIHH